MLGYSHPRHLGSQCENNFFIVLGLPTHFNWQKLKDLVREATINQPGWTSVDEPLHGLEGVKGYFSVKSQQDAENVYDFLVRVMYARLGRQLLVHHFDASSLEPFLVKCNCPAYYHGVASHSDNKSCIMPRSEPVVQGIPDWQPIAPVASVTGMPVPVGLPQMPMSIAPITHYQRAPSIAAQISLAPTMVNEHGLPINAANGVVRTESRSLHISGLAFSISEAELLDLLRSYGRPLGVELKRGHAIIRFGSTKEVRRAIEGLDRRMWRGRRISVKEDRDSTSVQEPVIVRSRP